MGEGNSGHRGKDQQLGEVLWGQGRGALHKPRGYMGTESPRTSVLKQSSNCDSPDTLEKRRIQPDNCAVCPFKLW